MGPCAIYSNDIYNINMTNKNHFSQQTLHPSELADGRPEHQVPQHRCFKKTVHSKSHGPVPLQKEIPCDLISLNQKKYNQPCGCFSVIACDGFMMDFLRPGTSSMQLALEKSLRLLVLLVRVVISQPSAPTNGQKISTSFCLAFFDTRLITWFFLLIHPYTWKLLRQKFLPQEHGVA